MLPATRGVRWRRGLAVTSLLAMTQRIELPLVALWLVLAGGLAALTSQVADWYVMTDELLYERLAISIVKLGSPLPHIHGELIANVNQLYPLLLAPLFHDRLVPPALHDAHVLNAFVMSSVCLPTFLLARDVTRSKRLSYFVASAAPDWRYSHWMVVCTCVAAAIVFVERWRAGRAAPAQPAPTAAV